LQRTLQHRHHAGWQLETIVVVMAETLW